MTRSGYEILEVSTLEKFDLGYEITLSNGNRYKYCRAGGTIAAGNILLLEDDGTAVALTTTNAGAIPQLCGVSPVAAVANDFLWVLISGIGSVTALASCVTDVKLYTTATAGALDDAVTTLISGIKLSATNGGSTANVACMLQGRVGVNQS